MFQKKKRKILRYMSINLGTIMRIQLWRGLHFFFFITNCTQLTTKNWLPHYVNPATHRYVSQILLALLNKWTLDILNLKFAPGTAEESFIHTTSFKCFRCFNAITILTYVLLATETKFDPHTYFFIFWLRFHCSTIVKTPPTKRTCFAYTNIQCYLTDFILP